ncbi:MAG TPA: hypothetical protein VK540_03970 [Polyangiaceae bacterium]|jgi:hypothetical protein|nr:hypothetical protein [Polyangiaceae bacterium]
MWGPIVYQALCSALPADVRDRTAGLQPLPEWILLDDLIAWHEAVWNGPAKRDEQLMTKHIHATVDEGFGRVKRFLISTSTPLTLAPRVASLWGEEYSTGRLQAISIEERSVHLTLTDHPYIESPLMRYVIAEVFRHVVSLTRAKDVRAAHAVRDAALVVVLRWA